MPELLAFCGVAAILAVTPGPDMALVARNALVGGRAAVPVTVLGICAGIVVHALAAAIGLSALLKASATAYAVVKVAGGAYLVYLGVQAWRASFRERGDDVRRRVEPDDIEPQPRERQRHPPRTHADFERRPAGTPRIVLVQRKIVVVVRVHEVVQRGQLVISVDV